MNDYILKYKYIAPHSWSNINGIIVEIDRTNFFYYIEDSKFEDYFVFFKDITCGECLKKDHYVFLHVWDYNVGRSKDPGILGYFKIDKCDFVPSNQAWHNDEKHSTFNNTKLFYKYFQQKYILRLQFHEIFYIPNEKVIKGQKFITYKDILTKYFKLESSLTEELKNNIPVDKIGNTYLTEDKTKILLEELNKSVVKRGINELPGGSYTAEFEKIIEAENIEGMTLEEKTTLSEINTQRINMLKISIEKTDKNIFGLYEFIGSDHPSPAIEQAKKDMDKLETLRQHLVSQLNKIQ